MKSIIDNAAGPTGISGIIIGKINDPDSLFSLLPNSPSEWLIFFSTALIICQLVHWGWRFARWVDDKNKKGV